MYQLINIIKIFIVLIVLIECNGDICKNKVSCTECLKEFECAWCDEGNENRTDHCYNKIKINEYCPSKYIIDPKSTVEILKNDPISLSISSSKVVQISPQVMKLTLRKDEEYTIDFQFGQSRDFPVDLYYLMDLSSSLKEEKQNLADIGKELVASMKKVTNDFEIGFGSFVDKTDAPFISTIPDKVKEPCTGCVPAYSYKNHMSLNSNGSEFARQVKDSKVSGNLDVPEGGFDALMQVMVCKEEIGWRNQSTRIIVFTTDAPFHVAGDGKLAGIVLPNDAQCHMVDNFYSEALTYDYPSVSHINHVAKQNHFNILFAVKDKVKDLYKKLETPIENSRAVGLNKKAIIQQIEQFYQEISTTVKMTANFTHNVHVSFAADCQRNNQYQSNIKECSNVTADSIINFRATIKALNCFDSEIVRIKPSNQDVILEIEVSATCECNCGPKIFNSPVCNSYGDLNCGVCECHKGYNGRYCECDKSKNEDFELNDKCKMDNETEYCSGRGSCICNVCQCDKKANSNQVISGKYCECDNYSCPKPNGLCSNNGDCECGKCKCFPEWSGTACECKNDNTTCTQNNQVCNNHGICECGKCVCETDYFGHYCEECTTCFGGKCDELKPCVECKVHNKGPYINDCDIKCTQYTINIVENVEENDETKICYSYEDNCKMVFTYYYENDKIIASALKELQCSEPINIIVLFTSIIAGIILMGIIALIVWKLWTNHQDKIEYAKFEQEREKRKWDRGDNPLFIPPVTQFQNPTYRRHTASKGGNTNS